MEPSKHDWILYKEKIGVWQEKYIETLLLKYSEILNNNDISAAERFWSLSEKIKSDKRDPGVCIELNKKNMMYDIVRLIAENVIMFDELEGFSEELRDKVNFLLNS